MKTQKDFEKKKKSDFSNRTKELKKDIQSKTSKSVSKAKDKAKKVKINGKRLALSIAVFVFFIYFVYVMISQQNALSAKNKEIQQLYRQVDVEKAETDRLNKELESVNNPEYLEKMAREKLGMVKPNERVFVDTNTEE